MLKVRGLKKTFHGQSALNGLDMDVENGALYGFVGANGAGKTTAIRIMAGLLDPDEGEVWINGKDALSGREDVRQYFGYVPDDFGMYDNLKVWEYMDFFAECYGYSGLVARNRCEELLAEVKLSDRIDSFVDTLSKGMKQRLCLARAMIHDPGLLILDEPMSGMDPRGRMEFKELLKELCAEGRTIFISSPALSDLSQMCTDIGIIDAGKIVLSGNISGILKEVNDSDPLVIRVCARKEKAVEILKQEPGVSTISIDDDEITIHFEGDRYDEAALLKKLTDGGVAVSGFMREQGDLENVFMQITDRTKERVVMSGET